LEALLRHKLPGSSNVTGMRLPDIAAAAAEMPDVATPNFQFDFSGIQEIAAAIKAGLRGKLPQIEEVTIEKLVPAAGGDVAAASSKIVTIDGQDVEATPKVGSSSTTTSTSTTVTTVPNTPAAADAATATDIATAATATAATSAAPAPDATTVAAAPAPVPDAAAAVTTVAPSVGSAGEEITETEVTVATPVPVAVAAPVPAAPAPNQRVTGSKASGGTWGSKKQQ
jgi:hypothetical protein